MPRPKCICFYNGRSDRPESEELRLSDAFGGDGDIEVKVTMININYGKNKALMEACEPLKEYAWLVDAIRKHEKISHDIEAAVDTVIDEMPDDFLIKKFLLKNKAEVKGMFLTEYDQEKVLAYERLEGIETARRNGKQIGQKVGTRLNIKKKFPVQQLILKYSKDFRGINSDREVIVIINMTTDPNDKSGKLHVSPNTYYKYKSELKSGLAP